MAVPSVSVRGVLIDHCASRLAILTLPDYHEPFEALMERCSVSEVRTTTLLATDRYDTTDGGR